MIRTVSESKIFRCLLNRNIHRYSVQVPLPYSPARTPNCARISFERSLQSPKSVLKDGIGVNREISSENASWIGRSYVLRVMFVDRICESGGYAVVLSLYVFEIEIYCKSLIV